MKVEQTEVEFKPVQITLESLEEVKSLERVLWAAELERERLKRSCVDNRVNSADTITLLLRLHDELHKIAWSRHPQRD